MTQINSRPALPRAQILTQQALATFERFMHIQASSGVVLLCAAVLALIWANSSFADAYHSLWHTQVGLSLGSINISQPLHFWINDALMTLFFLVVGMEVRYEIHAGSLSSIRAASLPVCAALGGVVVPALIFIGFNPSGDAMRGWAVPTATDIAFAVGLLALLGRGIPHNIRVFLLALAIIDDIVAVLIIAFFYTNGLDFSGFAVALVGLLMVFALQRMGVTLAWAYVLPGLVVWFGVLQSGAHPTLAGVVLGLLTPMTSRLSHIKPLDKVKRIHRKIIEQPVDDLHQLVQPLEKLRRAQRELLPPAIRLQARLHPWVAFVIMPIFAFANAGISLGEVDLSQTVNFWLASGVTAALVLGKPLGILTASWLAVRLGVSQMPPGVSWSGVLLVGLFAGIGFTMSIFISMLAFDSATMLAAAKLGVLLASILAAVLGLAWGVWYKRHLPQSL